MRKSVQVGLEAQKRCPCFGALCFLFAFISGLFGAKSASADASVAAAIKTTPVAAPAVVLGMSNPYLIAASLKMEKPKVLRFTFSRDLVDFVHRVERLARDGVQLNQRQTVQQNEKLNLLVQSRFGGGVLQLRYRR